MGSGMNFLVCGLLAFICLASTNAQKAAPAAPVPTPTPAPAPAPDYVNLTQLLSVAGPFGTFLHYLQTSKVIETFQNQANNTEEGITLFVPRDSAFSALKKPSLANLTSDQIKSFCLFHALPHYYSLAEFRNLSEQSPIPTFAGGQYTMNFTDNSGTVRLDSGWTKTKVISAVYSTDPVALYETDRVLLPEAIFGTDIPPTPAPAPAPETAAAPAADAPGGGGSESQSSPRPSSARKNLDFAILSRLMVAAVGMLLLFW